MSIEIEEDIEETKIYLAAPIVNIPDEWKTRIEEVYRMLDCIFYDVYYPAKHGVPNAWGMSMEEWSKCIFALDVVAINNSDWVVVCDFGRENTAGTAWEAGYAFGVGKKILVIKMAEDGKNYSVMMNGGSSNSISYKEFINLKDKENVFKLFVERGRLQPKEVFN